MLTLQMGRSLAVLVAASLLLAACGSKAPASEAPKPIVVVETAPVEPTATPPPLTPTQRAAMQAVQAYAAKLAPVVALGPINVNQSNGLALIEVLFANNVRQVYIAMRDNGEGWSVLTPPSSAANELLTASASSST